MKDKFITLKVVDKIESKLMDLESKSFLDTNPHIKELLTEKDGKTVIKWDTKNNLDTVMPELVDLKYARSIRFSVYSEEASGIRCLLVFVNAPKKGGTYRIEHPFTIDFVGWKHFDFTQDEMSGFGPKTKEVAKFTVNAGKKADGSSQILYFSGVDVTREVYDVNVPEGIDVKDPTLYTAVTQHVRDIFIGNEELSKTKEHKERLPQVDADCEAALKSYKETWQGLDKPNTLFGFVLDFEEANHAIWGNKLQGCITSHYKNVNALAKGYAMIGSKFYHDPEVLEAAKNCLEYGYEYYFGDNFVEYGPYANWWCWEIGIPMYLNPALAFIEDELTPELCAKYLRGFDYLVPYPEGTGGNKIELARLAIISAALRRNPVDLCIQTTYMNDIFDYIDSYNAEGGFFGDYSFIQHFSTPYTHGYGGYYVNDVPKMMYYLHGTVFFPQEENVRNHYIWILEAFRPLMYKNFVMNAVAGRGVASGRNEQSRTYTANIILMHYYAPDDIKKMLEPMLTFLMQYYNNEYLHHLSLCMANYKDELYAKLKDKTPEPYELTKVFGMMSRVVHHGDKFGAVLSLSSPDIIKFESFDGTNTVGWYYSDGMIQIYADDYTFDSKFYRFADPYYMPGVTCNSEKRIPMTHAPANTSPYAGGVGQGKYGIAGYINYYTGNADSFESKVEANVYAKKSYFFFDDEIVCVGSDIKDVSGTEVKTVLDNRHFRENDVFSIGNTPIIAPANDFTEISDKAVHFTNMGGYVILGDDKNTLHYRKVTSKYNGTVRGAVVEGEYDFLQLYLSHGTGEKLNCDKYFYAYLPTATPEKTVAYAKNPDVLLLCRFSAAHAVYEKKLAIIGANFFENASVMLEGAPIGVKEISSHCQSSVMIKKTENGEYLISVSDPTHTLDTTELDIVIDGVTSVVSCDERISATVKNGMVNIKVDTKNALRQTFNLIVK